MPSLVGEQQRQKTTNIKMKFQSETENEGLAGKNTVGGGDSGGAGRKRRAWTLVPRLWTDPVGEQRLGLFRKGDTGSIRGQRGAGFPAGKRQDHRCLLSLRFDKFRSLKHLAMTQTPSWGPLVT